MSFDQKHAPVDDIAMAQSIGLAFFFWQGTEQQVAEIFRIALAPADTRSIEIVYYGQKGFANRLDILNDVMASKLHGRSEAAEWERLYLRFKEALQFRHDLSHLSYRLAFRQRGGHAQFRGPLHNRSDTQPKTRLMMSETEARDTQEKLSNWKAHFCELTEQAEAFKVMLLNLQECREKGDAD